MKTVINIKTDKETKRKPKSCRGTGVPFAPSLMFICVSLYSKFSFLLLMVGLRKIITEAEKTLLMENLSLFENSKDAIAYKGSK